MTGLDKNVHIVPMGLEQDRVIEGLKMYPTNYAIFIQGKARYLKVEQIARRNAREIKKLVSSTIKVDTLELNLYDFETAFVEFKKLFDELNDAGYTVYVNISTGTRIISSAAMLACYMCNAVPYYVIPREYTLPKGKNVLTKGVKGVVQLPVMGINTPSPKEQIVLNALLEKGETVNAQKELMDAMPKSFYGDRKEGEDLSSFKARKRAKINRVVSQLAENGFVTLNKLGRNVEVTLTDSGKILCMLGKTDKRRRKP
jgi:hypothetical protein